MKLVYLTANDAWAFTYGLSIIQIGDGPRFFSESWEAIKAAQGAGLRVSVDTGRVEREERK